MRLDKKAYLVLFTTLLSVLSGSTHNFLTSEREGIQTETIFDLIKSDTIIVLKNNKIYELYSPILIQNVNNFTLKGNGATLKFLFDGKGFDIKQCNNITLTNLMIDNDNGRFKSEVNEGRINVENTKKAIVDSIIMRKQLIRSAEGPNHQILLHSCEESSVLNSVFKEAQGELIMLKSSKDCIVNQNKTTGGWSGIATAGDNTAGVESYGYRNKILNNEVKNATAALISINDRDALVKGNLIYSSIKKHGNYVGGPGIRFGHYQNKQKDSLKHLWAVGGMAINNKISDLTQATAPNYSSPYAIKVDATASQQEDYGLVISGNELENCRYGIGVSNQGEQTGIIEDNCIKVLEHAISLYAVKNHPHNFIVRNNTIKNAENAYVIRLWYSNAEVVGNFIEMQSQDSKLFAIGIASNTNKENVKIIGNQFCLNGTIGIFQISGKVTNVVIQSNEINGTKNPVILKEWKN